MNNQSSSLKLLTKDFLHTMLPALFLAIVITAASPSNSKQVSKNDASDLPVVGEVWGPAIIHVGELKYVQNSKTLQKSRTGQQDKTADYIKIKPSEIFLNKKNMEKYIQSVVTNDDVVVQLDPVALDGKYLEVVSSKVIPSDSVKMMCHYYETKLPFCHRSAATKLMYSMVRDDSGNLIPTVFSSHQGCARENGQFNCHWVSHISEIVVLDKRVV